MNIFIFLAIVLTFTLLFGKIIEKIRIPRVFAALFLGLILSFHNPFPEITSSEVFAFLSDFGMYLLLFIIGLELNIKELKKQWKFIAKLSFSLVFLEWLLWSIFIHFVFDVSWWIAILTATSFATVWEAILIPILDEFKIIKTKFWQTILWVGTLDDIVELITIVIMSIVLWYSVWESTISISSNFLLLWWLFLIPLSLQLFKSKIHHLKFKWVHPLFIFWLITLFIFIGIGNLVWAAALGAIFAWISIKSFLSSKRIAQFEWVIRTIAYGLFVPIFFLHVGVEIDIRYLLFSGPLLILTVLFITNTTKILTSYFMARKTMWPKKSILLGIWLSAKFSTSIVIITLLYGQKIIPSELYSVLIWSMIASKFIIPVAFSVLLKKRNLKFKKINN